MATISDISNEFVRNEIEEYLEQPDERGQVITTFAKIRPDMQEIAAHALKAGREPRAFETASFLFTVLDDTYEAALDRAAKLLEMIYNRPFRDAARKYCLLGRPEDWLEQMQAFARAGSRHFVFSLLSDTDEFIDAYANVIRPGLPSIEF